MLVLSVANKASGSSNKRFSRDNLRSNLNSILLRTEARNVALLANVMESTYC